jgi:hypothetical protein
MGIELQEPIIERPGLRCACSWCELSYERHATEVRLTAPVVLRRHQAP